MKHRQAWRIERAEPGATGGEAQSSKLKAQGKLQGSSSSDIVTELGAWSLVSTKHPVLLADLVKVRAVRAGASDSLSSVRNGGEEALRKFGPLAMVRHPSPRPSPRSCLTGRGRRTHYLLQRSGHGLSQQLMAMAATPASVTSRPAPPCPVPLSLAPGFSRVLRERRHANHFNGFSPSARETAAAGVGRSLPNTRLKPGANERAALAPAEPEPAVRTRQLFSRRQRSAVPPVLVLPLSFELFPLSFSPNPPTSYG